LKKKSSILFVGSFKSRAKDGSVGGQMFACNTIIKSELSNECNWILLDTTAPSNIKSSFTFRLFMAIKRLVVFFYFTIFCKVDKYLIFVGDGWSFWEKGLMILIAKSLSKAETIIAPRSGFIEHDLDNNVLLKSFIKYVLNKSDKVVCQSEKWQNLFVNLTKSPKEKFVIIENGIVLKPYFDFSLSKDSTTNVILYLSWVDKNKGIFDLLNAVLFLKNENLDFKLIVAGNGSAYKEAKKFISDNCLTENVRFVGWAYGEEKYKYLQVANIYVLPTHFEGYPNSLLEAMASGKACVATSVGSIPDMIEDFRTGLLVEKHNPIDIYKALKLLICDSNLRNRLSYEARNEVSKRNSIELFVTKFTEILIS
jgi:glycosyltransferase involved in cell wall biosynthesis